MAFPLAEEDYEQVMVDVAGYLQLAVQSLVASLRGGIKGSEFSNPDLFSTDASNNLFREHLFITLKRGPPDCHHFCMLVSRRAEQLLEFPELSHHI